jgi:hypothetical protein
MLEIGAGYSDISLLISLVALLFLIYTLLNIDKLGITVTNPRVLVEFALFVLFLIVGVWLKLRS